MATMRDLDTLALAMPDAGKEVSADGRPTYSLNGKYFCFHRTRRKDAVDPETGEPLDDVLVFRVDGQEAKELILADARGVFFTTPQWNGYPDVLLRIRDLKQLKRAELRDLVVDARLTRAPKRVAKAWLDENGENEDGMSLSHDRARKRWLAVNVRVSHGEHSSVPGTSGTRYLPWASVPA